jgi:predicted phosphoribosyltransferase
MRAAIRACQKKSAGKIVVAAPVASPEIARKIDQMEAVDDTVILRKPKFFRAVAQVYRNWVDVADHEVIEIMKEWRRHYALT